MLQSSSSQARYGAHLVIKLKLSPQTVWWGSKLGAKYSVQRHEMQIMDSQQPSTAHTTISSWWRDRITPKRTHRTMFRQATMFMLLSSGALSQCLVLRSSSFSNP